MSSSAQGTDTWMFSSDGRAVAEGQCPNTSWYMNCSTVAKQNTAEQPLQLKAVRLVWASGLVSTMKSSSERSHTNLSEHERRPGLDEKASHYNRRKLPWVLCSGETASTLGSSFCHHITTQSTVGKNNAKKHRISSQWRWDEHLSQGSFSPIITFWKYKSLKHT